MLRSKRNVQRNKRTRKREQEMKRERGKKTGIRARDSHSLSFIFCFI